MGEEYKWPSMLYLVRHGESAGNVALTQAEAAGSDVIEIACRDADVELSPLGIRQAEALGDWFMAEAPEVRPTVILSSPYRRALQTAERIAARLGPNLSGGLIADERLREKEFGILDHYTTAGVLALFPEQAALRRSLGKFYHRPPGGESWCDVILRLRSVMDTLIREQSGERVLIVGHQVVVLCFRYLLERMTEAEILAIDASGEVANCSVTSYAYASAPGEHGRMELQRFNHVGAICEAGEDVTAQPDAAITGQKR